MCFEKCDTDLYADDTTIHTDCKSLKEVESKLQNIENLSVENRMVIHPEKTKCIVITSRQKRATLLNKTLDVEINGKLIQNSQKENL